MTSRARPIEITVPPCNGSDRLLRDIAAVQDASRQAGTTFCRGLDELLLKSDFLTGCPHKILHRKRNCPGLGSEDLFQLSVL